MAMEAGQTILNEKYRIQRLIGEGAFARVWLAEDAWAKRQVAIKEPKQNIRAAEREEIERRFQQEIELAASLVQVPYVIHAFTVEKLEDDALILVMEYADGGSLAELIAQHLNGLPIERAVAITTQLCQALECFHATRLTPVHRDIKPSNILLTAQGEARLADFGLAQLLGMSNRSRLGGSHHPGTPDYAAPEQLRSPEPLLPAADLFALGCVLWEMLTGQPYMRHWRGTKPSELRHDTPTWLDQVVMQALAEDPWERWQSAGEMATALARGSAQAEAEARNRAEEQARAEAQRQAEAAERVRREAEANRQAEEQARLLKQREAEAARRRQAEHEEQRRRTEAIAIRERQRQAEEARSKAWRRLAGAALLVGAIIAGVYLYPRLPIDWQVLPTSLAPPTPVATLLRGVDGATMVFVPAGEFLMGSADSDSQAYEDEKPQHKVTLAGFWIDRMEVTNAQYRKFMNAGGYSKKEYWTEVGWAWKEQNNVMQPNCWGDGNFNQVEQPVVCVSWYEASAYARWAGGRLPSEAEWEKAARGPSTGSGDGRIYPWGNEAPDCQRLNYWGKDVGCIGHTAPVGSYANGVSPYGVLDLAGNVWEWTSSAWGKSSDKPDFAYPYDPADGRENQSGTNVLRVLRGGSWFYGARNVRSADRGRFVPGNRNNDVGFRVASPGL